MFEKCVIEIVSKKKLIIHSSISVAAYAYIKCNDEKCILKKLLVFCLPVTYNNSRYVAPEEPRTENSLHARECFLSRRGNAYYTHVRFPNRFPLSRTRPPARDSGHDRRSNNGSFRNCGQIALTAGPRGPAANIVHRGVKRQSTMCETNGGGCAGGQTTNNDLPVYPYGRA